MTLHNSDFTLHYAEGSLSQRSLSKDGFGRTGRIIAASVAAESPRVEPNKTACVAATP
jgi:hypothetical protein